MSVRDKLCRWFCDRRCDDKPPSSEPHAEVPHELRDASHRLNNAVSNLQSVTRRIARDRDVWRQMVETMQGEKR